MDKLIANETRTKTAVILFWIVLELDEISPILSYFQSIFLKNVVYGEVIS